MIGKMMARRQLLGSAAALAAQSAWSALAAAAPRAQLWPRWQAHDPRSRQAIDHRQFKTFLGRYVVAHQDGVNRVDYANVNLADKEMLDEYISTQASLPISRYGRAEQMAFWINLYNALTLQVVLDHYPVASIREIDISPGLFSSGPWGKKMLTIEEESVSLDDIEHQILRPIWRDPRIHYAVNCASIGCPSLRGEPYPAGKISQALDQAGRDFVNHARGVKVKGEEVLVSSIYHWFAEDFGATPEAILAHIHALAAPPLAEAMRGRTRIGDLGYDWSLNGASA